MRDILSTLVPGEAGYPRNHWYVAAYSHEVSEQPLSRTLLGKPVVLFRDEQGKAVALFDRCPHRGMPLSPGEVVKGAIQCPYHGMEFDGSGRCVHIPSSPDWIPERMSVTSYPLVEDWQFLWIWLGDPELADPTTLPDLAHWGFGQEDWFSEPAVRLEVAANYLLPIENLLDATHITFLHKGQIDQGLVASHPFEVEVDGRLIRVTRILKREKQSPLTMKTFGFKGEHADRSIVAETLLPALCGIRVEIRASDDPEAPPQINQLAVGITPRDQNSCYQFTAVAQTFPFLNEQRNDDLRQLLMEDVTALEQIQRLHDRLTSEQRLEFSVKSDEAAMRARRVLAYQIAEERDRLAGKTGLTG